MSAVSSVVTTAGVIVVSTMAGMAGMAGVVLVAGARTGVGVGVRTGVGVMLVGHLRAFRLDPGAARQDTFIIPQGGIGTVKPIEEWSGRWARRRRC